MTFKIISEPTGRALEYAALALNLYMGCSHGCRYCYAPATIKKNRVDYYSADVPKKTIVDRVESDARKLARAGDEREILLSFIGDPYNPVEIGITRTCIEILQENNLRFTVLTKGGTRAVGDFDLLEGYERARFGTSLVFMDEKLAGYWEPNAATIKNRLAAIEEAHRCGISTWVSLEPVIFPEEALAVIRAIHPAVDHWKVGKINGCAEAPAVDWLKFRADVTRLLEEVGADYYIKRSLTDLAMQARP